MTEKIKERFESKFVKTDGCWEWLAYRFPSGYGQFKIPGEEMRAHRVSYRLYVGDIPAGMCVCHQCDNPGCVNPNHLFLGTQADNIHDCRDKRRGVSPSGEKNGKIKLTDSQVLKVREKYKDGATQVEIAREFGVSRSGIAGIVRNRTRKISSNCVDNIAGLGEEAD